jgi:hypothetical protein
MLINKDLEKLSRNAQAVPPPEHHNLQLSHHPPPPLFTHS